MSQSERETAKIYQFPIRDRTAKGGRRDGQHKVADLAPVQFATAGSGWYHEAAVEAAQTPNLRRVD